MKVVLLSIGCTFCGLIFVTTPVPFLPMIYWQGFKKCWKEDQSVGWIAFYGVFNLPWALLPIAFIGGAYSSSGLVPAIFFAVGMYAALICGLFDKSKSETTSQ